jgi:Tol biopolymer transport system component
MDADGSNQKQLTFGTYEDQPQISPDNRWVVYRREEAMAEGIWKVPIEGGIPVRLTSVAARSPVVSPDGKTIACFLRVEQSSDMWKLAVIPFDGGQPLRVFDGTPALGLLQQIVRWTCDGSALTYIAPSGGTDNIWRQPVAGGKASQLTSFREGHISAFAWSPEGRYLACVHDIRQRDVILIDGFR